MKKRGRIVGFFLIVALLASMIGTTVTGIAKDINLGLDLQGGFEILYEVDPINEEQEVNRQVLEATVESLTQRVDSLGISEANINIEEPNRIRVQLAGVENQQEARELLSTTAELSFRDVEGEEYLDGSDIVEGSAQQSFDANTNQPVVTVEMESAQEFYEVSDTITSMEQDPNTPFNDRMMVIWLDYQELDTTFPEEYGKEDPAYISALGFNNDEPIRSTDVQIDGNFTVESAKQLADMLNSGSLPVNLEEMYSDSVGAQFGEQAMDKTIIAGAIGIALIFLYMIAYYRFPGFIATVTLSVYIYLILLVFELLNGVLTLPGIAALILGVGMAVDANIITYERIKEELKAGKTVMSAFKAGNKRSLATILDANITTMIAAAVLFIFGTSSVKGFATMLIISILVSFVTAVFGSRLFLGLWVKSKFLNKRPKWFGVKPEDIQDVDDQTPVNATWKGRTFDFAAMRKRFFAISILLIGPVPLH